MGPSLIYEKKNDGIEKQFNFINYFMQNKQ